MDESILSTHETDSSTLVGVIAKRHRERSKCQKIQANCTVVGGFIYMFFPGSVYILGNISPYIASYFRLQDPTQAANLLPAILAINVLIMPFGSKMVQNGVNPKKLIFTGGFLAFILLNVATFIERKFWLFFALYAIAFAVNHALTYMAAIHHGWLFFPKSGGLVSGMILAGYGFGALIFDNVSTAIVNPGGKYKKDEHGWYPQQVDN